MLLTIKLPRTSIVIRPCTVDGHRFGTKGGFAGQAIDPADPPRFESQAAYLRRHKLLLPGEEKRLTAADFDATEIVE